MATWARPVGGGLRDAQAVQTVSEAPTSNTEGLWVGGVAGYTFWASLPEAQAFVSGTVFAAWAYDEATAVWVRVPEADITCGAAENGLRRFAVTFTVASPRGRRIHVWDGTGPGPVTTTYTASLLSGESTF